MHHDLGTLYLFHAHVFFSIVAILGMTLLHAWAVRALPPPKLRRAALWTFGIGAAGVLITVPFCLLGWRLLM
jgi:hypothetical protein